MTDTPDPYIIPAHMDADFVAAWREMEDAGYLYSASNVEKVHLGWVMAKLTDKRTDTPDKQPTLEAVAWRYRRGNAKSICATRRGKATYLAADGWTETPLTDLTGATEIIAEMEHALSGYRAAVSYIGADSWDGCSDCIEILKAARTADQTWDWAGDANRIAEELKALRQFCAHALNGDEQ